MSTLTRRGLLGGGLTTPLLRHASAGDDTLAVNLVLALDASRSVDEERYRLQMDGYRRALLSDEVLAALPRGGIGLSLFEWAMAQSLCGPWTKIQSKEDMREFCQRFWRKERSAYIGGGTFIGGAIRYAHGLHNASPFIAQRRVIDISGDGASHFGDWPVPERDSAIARGIVINGLTILGATVDIPVGGLPHYYERNVIGGNGSFVVVAEDYRDLTRALIQKLGRELIS